MRRMETSAAEKSERGWRKGDPFSSARRREHLKGLKPKGAGRPCPGLNTREANEGHGWFGGMKPLGRRCEAARSYTKARERKEDRETDFRPSSRRKASKGEAHERWRLKETPKARRIEPLRG